MKIGIIGLLGAGKDTFAIALTQELQALGHEFIMARYATPLKQLSARVFNLTLEQLEDRVIKEKPVQVRRDNMVNEVFRTLHTVLKFSDEEMDEAAELYFEHFTSARAISPREFQQIIGTEVVRKVKASAWRDYLQSRTENLIVTDVRFENELCDISILVERFENIDRPKHSSEHLAWDYQFTGKMYTLENFWIVNNRTVLSTGDLHAQAKLIAKHIVKNNLGV